MSGNIRDMVVRPLQVLVDLPDNGKLDGECSFLWGALVGKPVSPERGVAQPARKAASQRRRRRSKKKDQHQPMVGALARIGYALVDSTF